MSNIELTPAEVQQAIRECGDDRVLMNALKQYQESREAIHAANRQLADARYDAGQAVGDVRAILARNQSKRLLDAADIDTIEVC